MYAQAVPVGQLVGKDAYLAGMVPVGSLGVYLGALTRLCAGVGLPSTAQYHQVKGALVRMGCIAQLRRGTAYRIGAWALLTRPSEELFAQRIGRLDRPAREAAQRRQHERDLQEFLTRPPGSCDLQALVRAAGASSGEDLVNPGRPAARASARAGRTLPGLCGARRCPHLHLGAGRGSSHSRAGLTICIAA
jgi:hypothetical protein